LHWSAFYGHNIVVDLLLNRGAQINATNVGRDTALHLASAHGHKDVVHMLLKNNADINAVNEHGNTPLHYACFWGYQEIAEELMNSGAIVGIANKYGEIALDKCKGKMKQKLHELAEDLGQDIGKKIQFRDQSRSGSINRTRNATLSRNPSINRNELDLKQKISTTHSGETWRGVWRKSGDRICAKFLAIGRELSPRILSDFSEEYQRLRIFSHPNVLPVIGCVDCPPNLIVVNQYMPYGSLYHILHESTGVVVVDTHQAIKFAIDIARGMAFLHTLNPLIPRFHLSSKHVMASNSCQLTFSQKKIE
jgi:integrin-linked kinase